MTSTHRSSLRGSSPVALALALVLAAGVVSTVAEASRASTSNAFTVALAKGPGGMKIEAKSSQLELDDAETVTVKVPISSLDTGIGLRDKHMKEKYLEADKHPHAVLSFPRSAITVPADGSSKLGKAKGKLSVHGVAVDKEFGYSIERKGGTLKVRGTFGVSLEDHKVVIPEYMGVKVDPNVQVSTSFELKAP